MSEETIDLPIIYDIINQRLAKGVSITAKWSDDETPAPLKLLEYETGDDTVAMHFRDGTGFTRYYKPYMLVNWTLKKTDDGYLLFCPWIPKSWHGHHDVD
jgi:hypothetical protein